MVKSYVKFQIPKEIVEKIVGIISIAKDTGKVRKGINETTKSIESGKAKFVVIAEDIEPEEIAMHIPSLCEEKNILFGYVPSKNELGRATGLNVSCSSISIENAGGASEQLEDVLARLGKKEEKKETEKKPEEKTVEKPEEIKSEEKKDRKEKRKKPKEQSKEKKE